MRGVSVFARLVLAAALFAAAATPVAAQSGKWWQSPDMRRQLQLTSVQVTSIETLYQASLEERQALRARLACLEADVQQLLAMPDMDDASAYRLISHLADTRARGNVARTRLLLAIRRQLTPGQRALLARVHPLH
jgi:Spy/CpxP family protein refolding chaperone